MDKGVTLCTNGKVSPMSNGNVNTMLYLSRSIGRRYFMVKCELKSVEYFGNCVTKKVLTCSKDMRCRIIPLMSEHTTQIQRFTYDRIFKG